jgi:hypothetical protein
LLRRTHFISRSRGGCAVNPVVIARSDSDEAIQLLREPPWIASLTLAMTTQEIVLAARALHPSLRGAIATKQSSFSRKAPWIASLTLAMTTQEIVLAARERPRFEGGE